MREFAQSFGHARDRPTDHGQSDSAVAKKARGELYAAFAAIPDGGVCSHLTLLGAAALSTSPSGMPAEPPSRVVDASGIRWPGYRSSTPSASLFIASDASPIAGATLSEAATMAILRDALNAARDVDQDLVLGGAQVSFAFSFFHRMFANRRIGGFRSASGQWFPSSDVHANLHSPGTEEDAVIFVRAQLSRLRVAAPQHIARLFAAAGLTNIRVESMPSWAIIKLGLELMPQCAAFLAEQTRMAYRCAFGTLFGAFLAFGELVVYIAEEGRLVRRAQRELRAAGDPSGLWQLDAIAVELGLPGPQPIPPFAHPLATSSDWGVDNLEAQPVSGAIPLVAPAVHASAAIATLAAAVAHTPSSSFPATSSQRERAGEHETGWRARGGHFARGGRGGGRGGGGGAGRPAAAGQGSQFDGADNAFFEERRRQREADDIRRLEDRLVAMERSLAEERRRNDAAPARGEGVSNTAARGGAASGAGRR
jgi:hypothetical protein